MTKRAQKIWESFKGELIVEPTDDMREALATAIRTLGRSFVYDDNGIAWFSADDFYKIADQLDTLETDH